MPSIETILVIFSWRAYQSLKDFVSYFEILELLWLANVRANLIGSVLSLIDF